MIYSDERWEVAFAFVDGLSWPGNSTDAFKRNPSTIMQVFKVVQKAGCKYAPDLNSFSYVVYKRPKVLRQLHRVLSSSLRQWCISKARRLANEVYITKEKTQQLSPNSGRSSS